MDKIGKIIFSTRTTAILLLLYALSMAIATFVENDYGTSVAKALIYESKWFEIIMVILILNFIGNIQRYKLLQWKKLPVLIFHLAFIFIFIGGAITRYISYEGSMHIREGEMSNQIVSSKMYFKAQISNGKDTRAYQEIPVILTPEKVPFYLKFAQRNFKARYDYFGKNIEMKVVDFIPRVQDSVIKTESGKEIIHLVSTSAGKRENIYIESGDAKQVGNALVSFNQQVKDAVNIVEKNGQLLISSPMNGNYMTMATQKVGALKGGNIQDSLHLRSLYQFPNAEFVIPEFPQKGKILHFSGDIVKHKNDADLVFVELSSENKKETISFLSKQGDTQYQKQVVFDGLMVYVGYGAKIYETPFYLKLRKFEMEHYPGSNSPSSYASEVSIVDEGKVTPYKIFMNHILDYKGYRFFQSSFDPDEKGTILSVNHDFWGTNITYLGYFLLFIGMFTALFWKGTHFWKLNKQLKDIAKNKKIAVVILMFFTVFAFSQKIETHGTENNNALIQEHNHNHDQDQENHEGHNHDHSEHTDSQNSKQEKIQPSAENAHEQPKSSAGMIPMKTLNGEDFANTIKIDKEHTAKFGALLVQGFDGRIEPVNTLALEILQKLYKKESFYSLDANQFLLSISINPLPWMQVPIIKVRDRGGKELLEKVKADEDGYTTLMNLFPMGPDGFPYFILDSEYKTAFAKRAADQTNYDKEIIEINDKVQVMQMIIGKQYLRFVPIKNDPKNTWKSYLTSNFETDAEAYPLIGGYFDAVAQAQASGNWKEADAKLKTLQEYQYKWGKDVIPSQTKINWELRYNQWGMFFKLMIFYAIVGSLVLALAFLKLFKENKTISITEKTLLFLTYAGLAIHFFALGIRWFISGHEPWSNGYEAVMFISGIGVLAGLLLYRNRNAFIFAAGCFVAVILMGFAHGGSQLNPQITPLVPVLKSYWLMIHVAVITSSYGFFGLSALIGTVVLILFIINHKKIEPKIAESVRELSIVNEMSLTIGIFLLTVGTFLGGMWANESWGRYWSWDPKETWAFISVMIYAFVLHLRLIPPLRGKYLFNLLSLVSFSSVIMTYFGVNYYLSGLHSYAQGDPVPVPIWVYVILGIVTILAIVSGYFYKKNFKKT